MEPALHSIGGLYEVELHAKEMSGEDRWRLRQETAVPIPEVCASLDIGPTALRRWVDQVRIERLGSTPVGAKAITADQREIQQLKALLRQKDLDIEILKKASALLLLDAKDHSR